MITDISQPEQQSIMQKFVNNHLHYKCCALVIKLEQLMMETGEICALDELLIDYEKFYQINCDEEETIEIMEYYIINDWVANRLSEIGEFVIDLEGIQIWGRQATGLPVYVDDCWIEVYNKTRQVLNEY